MRSRCPLASLLLAAALLCGWTPPATAAPQWRMDAFWQLLPPYGPAHGFWKRGLEVARTPEELQEDWQRLHSFMDGTQEDRPVPPVDLDKEMVLFISAGATTLGSSIVLENVESDASDGLVLSVLVINPGQGCMTMASLTVPMLVLRTLRAEGPIEAKWREVARDCRSG